MFFNKDVSRMSIKALFPALPEDPYFVFGVSTTFGFIAIVSGTEYQYGM